MAHRVLVVDDSKVLRLMIVSVLKKSETDIIIDQAVDGLEGMNMVKEHTYDLIITDLIMPNMGGLEFITLIRKSPFNKFVKICVLSGDTDLEKEKEARKAGATAFIKKPFDPPKLLQSFKKLLN